jgi:iron complex transport system substrate-binding protein
MRAALVLSLLALAGCGRFDAGSAEPSAHMQAVPMAHARTFRVYQRGAARVVDIEAAVIAWGGTAGGPPQRARLLLVPRDASPPPLAADLAGATVIRTPVMRIAVNDQPHEAIVRALGIADRLVAVGGDRSYDDGIRERVRKGEIQQVGYGWHQPPTLDALVAVRPDVFLARMADLTHTQHLERVKALGIPVVPVFIDAEPHYMGRVDWVRLVGMLTGRDAAADAFVAQVTSEVERLKTMAAGQPRRTLLWAWYAAASGRWSVTQRNGDAAMIRDANADLVMQAADNHQLDSFSVLSTEQLLRDATHADCWMIRDPLSQPFTRKDVLQRFKAYREPCIFWQPGMKNPAADAWEIWEMGAIRPDFLLADIVKMAHPALRDGAWRYHAPETREASSVGKSLH